MEWSEEDIYFDSREEISSLDWSSDECVSPTRHDEDWRKVPESVADRRKRFFDWMRLKFDQRNVDRSLSFSDRLLQSSGAVLRTTSDEESSRSSSDEGMLVIRNLDNGTEFVVDEVDKDGIACTLRQVGSNFSVTLDEFQRSIGQSPLVQRLFGRYAEQEVIDGAETGSKAKEGWMQKLSALAYGNPTSVAKNTARKVKVSKYKKSCKELSSLFAGQEFLAHKGSIGTMKFSVDGLYLASGGEDGNVRVWKVFEDERPNLLNAQNLESSFGAKKRIPACTVLPSKVFRVEEKPLHEFGGHTGEILDLAWSKRRFLLSASADSTVRLWQVGSENCLGVFSHTNYVTSVDFNPLDENYFISGSIDGKVRIWEVGKRRVMGYTDIKEIVTAVRYRPSGKGGLVGSVTGKCLFYKVEDHQMLLDSDVCLHKKNLPTNRITGFQFSPREPNKVVVTCADSVIRLLCGSDVLCKFKVSRLAASQMHHASFTSDGKHIVSVSDDSNIYIWNYNHPNSPRTKSIRSHESFSSQNSVLAIPWWGMETSVMSTSRKDIENDCTLYQKAYLDVENKVNPSSADWISVTRGFLLDSFTKRSTCWPKEKLPIPTFSRTKCTAHYKFLKNACQNMLTSSHMWGLVIVTAGFDGRIRTYLNYGLPLRLS